MRKKVIGDCTLYHDSMENVIRGIERVDHILSDPPYLYTRQEFGKAFDEQLFFENALRILPDTGFIALFGRGASFYRWNTRLAEQGFIFKEELVWDKRRCSGVAKGVSRKHETLSIHTKKRGRIRSVNVPYEEMRGGDCDFYNMGKDISRVANALGKSVSAKRIKKYIDTKIMDFHKDSVVRHNISGAFGKAEDTYIRATKMIELGVNEKSIISIDHVHHHSVHPAQKPVRLAERIIALISDVGDVIYDPFIGSGSFGVACFNTGRKYIGSEINAEYFEIACNRIEQVCQQPTKGRC
jgi:site-specific DNA-methyltransferase (adenine-specific)